MAEETVKQEITFEEVMNRMAEMHEVAAAMKQCNPNMTPLRAMVLERWRNILWEDLPIVKDFLLKHGDVFNQKPAKGSEPVKKRIIYLKPKKGLKG